MTLTGQSPTQCDAEGVKATMLELLPKCRQDNKLLKLLFGRNTTLSGEIERVAQSLMKADIDSWYQKALDSYWEAQDLKRRFEELKATPLHERGESHILMMSDCLKGYKHHAELYNKSRPISLKELEHLNRDVLEKSLVRLIIDLRKFLNVRENLTFDQLRPVASMIVEDCKGLTLEHIAVCFHKAKKGDYGTVYGRLDGQVIIGWLEKFKKERREKIANEQQNLHLQGKFKADHRSGRILPRKEPTALKHTPTISYINKRKL